MSCHLASERWSFAIISQSTPNSTSTSNRSITVLTGCTWFRRMGVLLWSPLAAVVAALVDVSCACQSRQGMSLPGEVLLILSREGNVSSCSQQGRRWCGSETIFWRGELRLIGRKTGCRARHGDGLGQEVSDVISFINSAARNALIRVAWFRRAMGQVLPSLVHPLLVDSHRDLFDGRLRLIFDAPRRALHRARTHQAPHPVTRWATWSSLTTSRTFASTRCGLLLLPVPPSPTSSMLPSSQLRHFSLCFRKKLGLAAMSVETEITFRVLVVPTGCRAGTSASPGAHARRRRSA